MRDGLQSLYALQEVDSAIMVTRRHLEGLDRAAAEQEAMAAAKAAHEAAAAELHHQRAELRDAELEVASLVSKKKSHEEKLYGGRVSAYKEMEAMADEIQSLDRHRARLEDHIIALWEAVAAAETAEAETRATRETTEAAFAAKHASFEESEAKLTRRLRQLAALRSQRLPAVPADLVRRYDAICAQRRGVGIARVVDRCCGACHLPLPSNTLRQLRETENTLLCESCGRILCEVEQAPSSS